MGERLEIHDCADTFWGGLKARMHAAKRMGPVNMMMMKMMMMHMVAWKSAASARARWN